MADETAPALDLTWYVNALGEDAPYAAASEAEATEMVESFIGEGNPYNVPPKSLARAVLEVGADLYYRKSSRNGVIALDSIEPQMFRLNRDPMAAAYPILRRYLVTGI